MTLPEPEELPEAVVRRAEHQLPEVGAAESVAPRRPEEMTTRVQRARYLHLDYVPTKLN